ncbi:MAG: hypothetical protein EPO11_05455 [Gammaproteobacteria bacterium]|nr:MAG: hypothetical protein EPO11_05455 [Gammaproteobacteria bacterium]
MELNESSIALYFCIHPHNPSLMKTPLIKTPLYKYKLTDFSLEKIPEEAGTPSLQEKYKVSFPKNDKTTLKNVIEFIIAQLNTPELIDSNTAILAALKEKVEKLGLSLCHSSQELLTRKATDFTKYHDALENYLNSQLKRLPKNSARYKQLKLFLDDLKEIAGIKQMKDTVSELKKITKIHIDTGVTGFFKGTWAFDTKRHRHLKEVFGENNELLSNNVAKLPLRVAR